MRGDQTEDSFGILLTDASTLRPHVGERPVAYADRMGNACLSAVAKEKRKALGQYLTPVPIAHFMAGLFSPRHGTVRILDPGAGAGILACAVCEHFASTGIKPKHLVVDAYEIDSQLSFILRKNLLYLRDYLQERNVDMSFTVHSEDFIVRFADRLDPSKRLFRPPGNEDLFDAVISNPPYAKLSKSDPRAVAAASVVHGQPNIYALFMAVAASLLRKHGEIVVITPRSFASGAYFRLFRERFFEIARPERIHVFESRSQAFVRDEVLQENVVLKAVREDRWQSGPNGRLVEISESKGVEDIRDGNRRHLPLAAVLDTTTRHKLVRIPTSSRQERSMEIVHSWHGSLHEFGLEVSTGPVVAFRAKRYIIPHPHKNCAPLLWMQNVKAMRIEWPVDQRNKPQYIEVSEGSQRFLVRNANYVLLRRFSAKEEVRRITAAPFRESVFDAAVIGIENHLNYIYRPKSEISQTEAFGLAALYNSSLLNDYFRALNGNTQVNATELRSIPLPPLEVIERIGEVARRQGHSFDKVEVFIDELLLTEARLA